MYSLVRAGRYKPFAFRCPWLGKIRSWRFTSWLQVVQTVGPCLIPLSQFPHPTCPGIFLASFLPQPELLPGSPEGLVSFCLLGAMRKYSEDRGADEPQDEKNPGSLDDCIDEQSPPDGWPDMGKKAPFIISSCLCSSVY